MKEITTVAYQCEKCKSLYSTEQDANNCENQHIGYNNAKIIKAEYFNALSKYPTKFIIQLDDNSEYTYKLES